MKTRMRPRLFPRLSLVSYLFLLATLPAFAEPSAPTSLNSTSLEWNLSGATGTATLTISGPRGNIERRTFAPGKAPTFSIFDGKGTQLPEGVYTWELVVSDRASSGTFRIENGAFSVPGATERRLDDEGRFQTIADDLIVQGNTCIGLDCANNEAFGTDNLRLKANLLRLRFEDTSTAAGFPATDWQLTANDADTGGANKFSLDDATAGTTPLTVRGGAPSHSLFIDAAGRVGFGTSTPTAQLHLFGTNPGITANKILVENTSTTILGRELYELKNHGPVAFIVRDDTEAERWSFGTFFHRFLINEQSTIGVVEFDLSATGNLTLSGTLTQSSDRDAKADILAVEPSQLLAKVAQLPISTWRYKTDPENVQHLGPMAQDFAATFGLGADDKHIAPGDMAGVSLAAIQALVTEVQDLRANNQQLAAELAALRSELEAVKR